MVDLTSLISQTGDTAFTMARRHARLIYGSAVDQLFDSVRVTITPHTAWIHDGRTVIEGVPGALVAVGDVKLRSEQTFPIVGSHPQEISEFFENVEMYADGDWWAV